MFQFQSFAAECRQVAVSIVSFAKSRASALVVAGALMVGALVLSGAPALATAGGWVPVDPSADIVSIFDWSAIFTAVLAIAGTVLGLGAAFIISMAAGKMAIRWLIPR